MDVESLGFLSTPLLSAEFLDDKKWLVLLTVPLIVVGFAIRMNPLFTVIFAGVFAGVVGGLDLYTIISDLGKFFVQTQSSGIIWLIMMVLAILEINGIREQAGKIITSIKSATTGRILMLYFLFRQITAMLGLLSLCGQARTVRPLLAPMAEAKAKSEFKGISQEDNNKVKAQCAATDNVAAFFGEDVFVAVQSILIIKAYYDTVHIDIEPLQLSVWAIPTAIAALVVYMIQVRMFEKRLKRKYAGGNS